MKFSLFGGGNMIMNYKNYKDILEISYAEYTSCDPESPTRINIWKIERKVSQYLPLSIHTVHPLMVQESCEYLKKKWLGLH